MCGFAGFACIETPEIPRTLETMGRAIEHRGPNSSGVWHDDTVGFVHQRLAIQDLSPLGHQPMASVCGRYQLVFNGEVYNFNSLRSDLEQQGHKFNGQSDTEVILKGFEVWGLESTLKKMKGMFALALYDVNEKNLFLARDRMGEKPLYYSFVDGGVIFGSELHALKVHPRFNREIDRDSLAILLRHNVISAPNSIYKNTKKLLPSHYLKIELSESHIDPESIAPHCYWSLEDCFSEQVVEFNDASESLENTLISIIDEQMISDAPLGAFLSGGIDSSTIVALMQIQSSRPIKTFTIGFNEPGFNEAEHAKAVAEHLGTEHTELYVSAKDALRVVEKLSAIYDEPFADSSQIPTYLLSSMTKEHVTVALSGDGGDELLCGYSRYLAVSKRWSERNTLKNRAKKVFFSLPGWLLCPIVKLLHNESKGLPRNLLKRKINRERVIMGARSIDDFYRQSVSLWGDPSSVVLGATESEYGLTLPIPDHIKNDPLKTMMWQDLNWYLPDDILVKVDRAAMACSLETRVPMLDHRFVEQALSINTKLNVSAKNGKQLLRSILYRHVPQELVDRPKTGFGIPIDQWLRGDLKSWAEVLLEPDRLQREGFFNVTMISDMWQAHISSQGNYGYELWGILMFQVWLENE